MHSFHPAGRVTAMQENKGFSLIFVSILLTVVALIFASLISGQEAGDINQKNINNTQKLERVEDAMRSFMAANGRRPCPADGQYAENTKYFGIEAGTPGACTGNTAPIPNAPLGPDTNTTLCNGAGCVVGGTIPTKTLGLPDDYAYDDYGRRFTYVVDLRATNSAATAVGKNTTNYCSYLQNNIKYPDFYGNIAIPAITIENTTTPLVPGNTIIDHTMYAYISHGSSGYGAWPAQGSVATLTTAQSAASRIDSGSTDIDKMVNASADPTCMSGHTDFSGCSATGDFTNVRVRKNRIAPFLNAGNLDTGFDDFVWYRQDSKNTCCLGVSCLQTGFITPLDGNNNTLRPPVATGDVNGDGIADLIIGAYSASPGGRTNAGAVFVVFGTRLGFPDPLPLTNLNGTNGFVLDGAATSDQAGYSVAAGDVNGDGIADIIIGAPSANGNTGSAYVIFGRTGTWPGDGKDSFNRPNGTYNLSPGVSLVDGVQGVRFDGVTAGDSAGYSVATGDVNGDGYADIIIGSPFANSAGSTYVVFGKSTITSTGTIPFLPAVLVDSFPSNSTLLPIGYGSSYTGLMRGQTLTGGKIPAGKTTTIANCQTGAPPPIGTPCKPGKIALISPSVPAWLDKTIAIATTPLTSGTGTFIDGTQGIRLDGLVYTASSPEGLVSPYISPLESTAPSHFGSAVAAGDINGDGYADLIIGAPNALYSPVYHGAANMGIIDYEGSTYVLFGKNAGTRFLANIPGTTSNTSNILTITGSYSDLIVGETLSGAGIPFGTTITSCTNGTNTVNTIGVACPSGTVTVTLSGTANGPSTTITIATAPLAVGAAYSATGNGTFIDGIQGFRLDGTPYDTSGTSVAAGDINGDGYADVIIGANTGMILRSGYVAVVFGRAGQWPGDGVINGNYNANSNGNGAWMSPGTANSVYSLWAEGLQGTGQACSSSWTPAPTWTCIIDGTHGLYFYGIYPQEFVGGSVATGDVNGNGIPDLLIGGTGYTYVIFGNSPNWNASMVSLALPSEQTLQTNFDTQAGTNLLLNTVINGTQGFRLDNANSGPSITPDLATGDVNGDGVADIIIGGNAWNATDSAYDGTIYTYFGHKNSLNNPWPAPSGGHGYYLNKL